MNAIIIIISKATNNSTTAVDFHYIHAMYCRYVYCAHDIIYFVTAVEEVDKLSVWRKGVADQV